MRAIAENPLADGLPDDWAVEWGQDGYGVFQSFAVKGVVQRMRWIPGGRFTMGSPEGEVGRWDDETEHEVVLTSGYWLAETPCTQALWKAVMGTNPSHFQGDDRRPVEKVSWEDCQVFLQRLGELLALQASGASGGADEAGMIWRLPTEAEWERACRAGTTMATWAGDLAKGEEITSERVSRIAWYHANSSRTTHPVGELGANPYGLQDVLGNVEEWCWDWFAGYSPGLATDPCGPTRSDNRVYRGGSWLGNARYCRAAYRDGYSPQDADADLGFRLARGRAPSSGRSSGAEPRGGAEGGRRAEPPAGGAGAGRTRAPRSR